MPRYDYSCSSCGERIERTMRMSEYVSSVACDCGAVADRLFDTLPEVLVRGNQKSFKLDASSVPIGWERGNTDTDKQERRYAKLIGEKKKAALKVDKEAIKGGIRHIASVPREMMRSRSNQFGKDYFDPSAQTTTELKAKLKEENLLFKD